MKYPTSDLGVQIQDYRFPKCHRVWATYEHDVCVSLKMLDRIYRKLIMRPIIISVLTHGLVLTLERRKSSQEPLPHLAKVHDALEFRQRMLVSIVRWWRNKFDFLLMLSLGKSSSERRWQITNPSSSEATAPIGLRILSWHDMMTIVLNIQSHPHIVGCSYNHLCQEISFTYNINILNNITYIYLHITYCLKFTKEQSHTFFGIHFDKH